MPLAVPSVVPKVRLPPIPVNPEFVTLIRYELRFKGQRNAIQFSAVDDAAAIHKAFELLNVFGRMRNEAAFAAAGGAGVYRLPDNGRIYPVTKH